MGDIHKRKIRRHRLFDDEEIRKEEAYQRRIRLTEEHNARMDGMITYSDDDYDWQLAGEYHGELGDGD
jgi:hypothetical protein